MHRKYRLDLGGVACYTDASGRSVGISLDNTSADDEITPRIVGDYNHAPFAKNTFSEAHGCCYFEDTYDLAELARILRPGARVKLSSCQTYEVREKWSELDDMMKDIVRAAIDAAAAGFDVEVEGGDFGDLISFPWFTLTKRKE